MTGLAEITTVQVHAWSEQEDGSQEYADAAAGEKHDGWSVYLRVPTPDDPVQPFDVLNEQDYATKEQAMEAAEALSAVNGSAPIDVY